MQLKRLLTEQEKIEKLSKLLQEKYRNDIQHLVYRGTTTPVDNFDTREIRKDRTPRDTPKIIEALVSAYEENLYPSYPKRSESKFGATNRKVVSQYGPHQVAVFPEKDANVKSLKQDSTPTFFNPAFQSLESIVVSSSFNRWMKKLKNKNFDVLLRFLGLARKLRTGNLNYMSWKSYLRENLQEVLKEVKRLSSSNLPDNLVDNTVYIFRSIDRYFKLLDEEIGEKEDEVIFDGESYLRVDPKFFTDNFMWSGRRWVES